MKRACFLLIPLSCYVSAVALGQGPAGKPPPPYLSEQELVGKTAFTFLTGRTLDIVLPKEGTFSPEETFTLEGVLVGEDGSPVSGLTVFFFALDEERSPVIYRALDSDAEARAGPESERVYSSFLGDRRVILNPRVKSDARGRFLFRLGPAWQEFASATIGFLVMPSEAALPRVAALMVTAAPGGGLAIPVTQGQRKLNMGKVVVKGDQEQPRRRTARLPENRPGCPPECPRLVDRG